MGEEFINKDIQEPEDIIVNLREEVRALRKSNMQLETDYQKMHKIFNAKDLECDRLVLELLPLRILKQKVNIESFRHIKDEEVQGFALFECNLAKYPHNAGIELRAYYARSWERAYWNGFLKRCDSPARDRVITIEACN